MVEVAPTIGGRSTHQLFHGRRGGQRHAGLAGEVERVPQVLEVQPDSEAGLELA